MQVPKPVHNRRVPKRKSRTNFSASVIREIGERDQFRCVRCLSPYIDSIPHHVIYRSALGEGSKRNGVTICRPCHDWAHRDKKKNNEWFVQWVELNLDENGDLKQEYPVRPNRL